MIINGKSTTKTVEKIGTLEEVKAKCGDMDPYEWARQYVKELTEKEKRDKVLGKLMTCLLLFPNEEMN